MKFLPLRSFAPFLLVMLILAPSRAESKVVQLPAVSIEDFVGSGVPFEKRIRLKIRDIRVGNISVRHLFQEPDQPQVTSAAWLLGLNHEAVLMLQGKHLEQDLRGAFLESYAEELTVDLEDEIEFILRGWVPDSQFQSTLVVPVNFPKTPCEQVTRIVYQEVDDILGRIATREGETSALIQLNEVFQLLIKDRINPFLNSLSPIDQNHECFETFDLLKWLRGEEIYGFVQGEYEVHAGLQDLLNPIVAAIKQVTAEWQDLDFEIHCTGFADSETVDGIKLERSKTGVKGWGRSVPFEVRCLGCVGDQITSSSPKSIDLDSPIGAKVSFIRSNCELAAARAYVVATYLVLELNLDRSVVSYASGGVMTKHKTGGLNRRVSVEMIVKASKSQ